VTARPLTPRARHARLYRAARIAAACLVAAAFIAGIAAGAASSAALRLATLLSSVQLLPSLAAAFATGLAGSGLAWLAILALTALGGRFYCSVVCPLGLMQDAAFRARLSLTSLLQRVVPRLFHGNSGSRGRSKKPAGSNKLVVPPVFRLALAGAGVLGAALAPAILAWLEPYAQAARFSASLLGTAWEAAGEAGLRFGIQLPAPSPRPDAAWMLVALLPGLLILAAAVLKPRAYCRWLCPSGALLGLVAERSLFRFHIDAPTCTSCGACERVCRTGAAHSAGKRVDPAACVACFDCVAVCPTGSARYGNPRYGRASSGQPHAVLRPAQNKPVPASTGLSRRNFMLAGGTGVVAAALALPTAGLTRSLFSRTGSVGTLMPVPAPVVLNGTARAWASPPGAVSTERFSRLCLSCGLCARSCPSGVLRQGVALWKSPAILEPYMDYSRGFCQFECVACGEACPTGAILPLSVERKTTTAVAKSRLDLPLCIVVEKGTRCGACAEHCPTGALTMERVPQAAFPAPVLDATLCIGCGACETVCPAEPKKALVVTGLAVHETASVLPSRPGREAQLSPVKNDATGTDAPYSGGSEGFPF